MTYVVVRYPQVEIGISSACGASRGYMCLIQRPLDGAHIVVPLQVVTYAAPDDDADASLSLEFPVGRHIVTGDLAKSLWEQFVHHGPYNSTLSTTGAALYILVIQSNGGM